MSLFEKLIIKANIQSDKFLKKLRIFYIISFIFILLNFFVHKGIATLFLVLILSFSISFMPKLFNIVKGGNVKKPLQKKGQLFLAINSLVSIGALSSLLIIMINPFEKNLTEPTILEDQCYTYFISPTVKDSIEKFDSNLLKIGRATVHYNGINIDYTKEMKDLKDDLQYTRDRIKVMFSWKTYNNDGTVGPSVLVKEKYQLIQDSEQQAIGLIQVQIPKNVKGNLNLEGEFEVYNNRCETVHAFSFKYVFNHKINNYVPVYGNDLKQILKPNQTYIALMRVKTQLNQEKSQNLILRNTFDYK